MKKLAGMMPPTLVLAEEGKNGDCGPPPSSCGDAGALVGLRIRSFGLGKALRYTKVDAGSITISASAGTYAARKRPLVQGEKQRDQCADRDANVSVERPAVVGHVATHGQKYSQRGGREIEDASHAKLPPDQGQSSQQHTPSTKCSNTFAM